MIQISPSGGEPSEDVIDLLQLVLEGMPETYIEVGKVVGALGARSFGIAILLFSLPMIIPMPPGVPMTAGFVICIFAVQLLLDRSSLWLPNWLSTKQIKREALVKAYDVTDQYLGWMFRLARPRFPQLTGLAARRIAGLLFIF